MSRRSLGLVLGIALSLRLAVALALWQRVPIDDERAYDEVARSLVAGNGFSTERPLGLVNPGGGAPTSLWGCLQPLYLALAYALLGPRPGPVYLLNAVVGLVTVWGACWLGARAGGARAAVVAGGITALDVYLLKLTASLLTETLYTALLVAALVALVRWCEERSRSMALLAGSLLGLASLARALAFYFALLALGWVLVERREDARRAAREAALFLLALLVTIAPWVVRNRLVHDPPVFLDSKAGWNLYGYLHPEFDPRAGNQVAVPREVLDPGMSEARRNRSLLARARGFLLDDPLRVLRMAPAKVWLLWSPFAGRSTDPALAPVKLLFVLPLEAAAVLGMLRARGRSRVLRLVYALIAYYVLVHAVMVGGPRFRVPLDPGLAVLAAAAFFPPARKPGQSRTSPSTPE